MGNKFAFVKDGKIEIDIGAISKARERVIDVPKSFKDSVTIFLKTIIQNSEQLSKIATDMDNRFNATIRVCVKGVPEGLSDIALQKDGIVFNNLSFHVNYESLRLVDFSKIKDYDFCYNTLLPDTPGVLIGERYSVDPRWLDDVGQKIFYFDNTIIKDTDTLIYNGDRVRDAFYEFKKEKFNKDIFVASLGDEIEKCVKNIIDPEHILDDEEEFEPDV